MRSVDRSVPLTGIEELLADYMDRLDRGVAVDQERFLAEPPAEAVALRAFFEASDELNELVHSVPEVAPTVRAPGPGAASNGVGPQPVSGQCLGDYELLERLA